MINLNIFYSKMGSGVNYFPVNHPTRLIEFFYTVSLVSIMQSDVALSTLTFNDKIFQCHHAPFTVYVHGTCFL